MEANENETLPVLHMCRLCLSHFGDCIEIGQNESYIGIWKQIKKYLSIEIDSKDFLPQRVCQSCVNRIQSFDKFYNEVSHNQELLRLSQTKDQNHSASVISLASQNVPFTNESETFILAVANTSDMVELAEKPVGDNLIEVITEECHEKPSTFGTEQEFNDLASNDIAVELRIESGNEGGYNEDEDDDRHENSPSPNVDSTPVPYKNFPTKVLDGCKLLYKGHELLNMISRFYHLECDQCDNEQKRPLFQRFPDLCQHYADCHQMKGYVMCCKIKLIKPRALALHMAKHLQPEDFKCKQCNKMFSCPKILRYHVQNHRPESERPFPCSQCPRRFSYSSALVAHNISHQPENEREAHICDECGKMFASAGRLTTHINVNHMQHGPDHTCRHCHKTFANKTNLTYHLTTHQPNVRRVQCSICDKWLKNKLCLRKHMVQHSSIRYNCSICDYSALNQQCLRNHMRVQHSNEKPFRCDECGKAFKLKNTLLNHLVQHTGIRKFVCLFCNRKFASSGNYYSHRKRMHPQELAAMNSKKEEDERLLREQLQQTSEL